MTIPVSSLDLITRRTRQGYNRAESAELLAELVTAHSGENLVHALTYTGFATEAQARRFANQLAERHAA